MTAPADFPLLRPQVKKTYVKGFIALGVFSLFMQLSLANLVNYLIFLSVSVIVLTLYALYKRSSSFEVKEDAITVRRRVSRRVMEISYDNILDMSVAQGMLARRFRCGTLFMILKGGEGSVKLMGGGRAERLEDIPSPQLVYDYIAARLGPFSTPQPETDS